VRIETLCPLFRWVLQIRLGNPRTIPYSRKILRVSGVGIVLITVSGIAWRLTSQDAPSCRAMLGLSSSSPYADCDARFLSRPPYGPPRTATAAAAHPYAGMMYSEFQYRPPPPSYQASMQEYRLRLLLMDRNAPPPPPPPLLSPPPAYRGLRPGFLAPLHGGNGDVSRPPSYRSRASDHHHHHLAVMHGRHPSQLSSCYLSHVLSEEQEQQESKEPEQQQHASVVPVIPAAPLLHKSSIRIESSSSNGEKKGEQQQQHYITNLQGQFHEVGADGKKGLAATLLADTGSRPSPLPAADRVTIVQNNGQRQPPPPSQQSSGYLSSGPFLGRHSGGGGSGGVVVTVSAHCDAVASLRSSPEVDILAHL
jgi:hypothetical protein